MALTSGQSGDGKRPCGLYTLLNGDSNDMFEVVSVLGHFFLTASPVDR